MSKPISKRVTRLTLLVGLLGFSAGILFAGDEPKPSHKPLRVSVSGQNAYSLPVPALDRLGRRAFAVGNSFFKDNWVSAPASAVGRDGLGPLFSARSCSSCHLRDGRSQPSFDGGVGLVFRINSHPEFGGQLQDRALPGVEGLVPEATVSVSRSVVPGRFDDGTSYELERLAFTNEHGIPMSARVGPAVIGMGLLEAVSEKTLRELADPDDKDGDGISGRIHEASNGVGRFGWKATQPTVMQQVASAFHEDIGITTPLFPEEALTETQTKRWGNLPSGGEDGEPEIDAHKLQRVTFYTAHLAVPVSKKATAESNAGETLFHQIGCASCHVPRLRTGADAAFEPYRDREISPYTDLLLHDMGPGLADTVKEGNAQGAEWRTPPLWGLGYLEEVSGHTRLLHDGRARNIEEAILWHGGEASGSRDRYRGMKAEERAALLAFLERL